MRRGEVWTIAGGADYARKPRPALIVHNELLSEVESVTFCGLTTEESDSPLLRPLIEPDRRNGLRQASRVMVDKITTVRRERLGRHIGTLSPQEMERVDRGLMVFLGLAG